MSASDATNEGPRLRTQFAMREAVLALFRDEPPERCLQLLHLSHRRWQLLLRWLDISGLALPFLHRMKELGLDTKLPILVRVRLERNLRDNLRRTEALLSEAGELVQAFNEARLSYALLKGFSLVPHSVPRPELRSQLDLDFLIAAQSAEAARAIVEQRQYTLHAISGRTYEFKAGDASQASLKTLYSPRSDRSLELHLAADDGLLSRAYSQRIGAAEFQVLAPADLFVGQGMHLFKHVCSEFFRVSHLLEFRRHVLTRRHDAAFWDEVRSIAEGNRRITLAFGVIVALITHAMGEVAPPELTSWTSERLPFPAHAWIARYGTRAVLASAPGSKLYLLLQRELEAEGATMNRSVRSALLPRRLPPRIAHVIAGESRRAAWRRVWKQLHYLGMRLRFHLLEGIRFHWEEIRWRRYLQGRSL